MTSAKPIPRIKGMNAGIEETALRRRLFLAGTALIMASNPMCTPTFGGGGAPSYLGVLLRYARGECERLAMKDFQQAAETVAEALDLLRGPERLRSSFPTHYRALLHVRRFSLTDPAGLILEAALCRFALRKGYAVRRRRLLALAGSGEEMAKGMPTDAGGYVRNERAREWLAARGITIRVPLVHRQRGVPALKSQVIA